MTCSQCGSILGEADKFCFGCGARTQRSAAASSDIMVTIGRSAGNQIVLNDQSVSGRHALIRERGGSYVVEDLNSTNGTFVNGKRIMIAEVRFGETVMFGSTASLNWNRVDEIFSRLRGAAEHETIIVRPVVRSNSEKVAPVYPPNLPAATPPTPPIYPQQSVHAGLGGELAYAMHMSKSFVGRAFLAFLLYYIGFYIVGLVANILFLSSANRTKAITRMNPPGRGCLVALLVFHVFIPLVVVLLIIAFGTAIFKSIF